MCGIGWRKGPVRVRLDRWAHIDRKDFDWIRPEVRMGDSGKPASAPGQSQALGCVVTSRVPQGQLDKPVRAADQPFLPIGCDQAVFFELPAGFDLVEVLALEG